MLSYLSKEDIQDIDKQRQKLAQEAREQANNRGSTGRHRLQTGNGVRHLPTAADAAYKGKVVALDEMPADVASAFRGEKIDLSGAQQLQSEKSTVSKVLSDPMYYAEKVMSKPLDVVQSGVKDLFGGTKKQEERLAANKQMQAAETPSIGKAVEGVLVKGADFAVSGVTSTLDWLLGNAMKEIGWENNPISKLNEFTQKTKEANAEYYAKNLEKGTDAQKKLDEYGTMTAAAIPQAVIAMMSAGASAGAQGAGMLAKGGTQLAGAEAAASTAAAGQTVKNVATAMAKDPNYWTAFASVAGDSYQKAKEDGASDWEANMYALANGLGNAAIEVGGGIQTLPVELQAGKRGVRAWIRSMADEGKEEAVQGVIERALQNLTYGKGNSILSTKDENAVLNPVTAAKEFAGGAVVGGVLGGGQMLADAAINRGTLPGGRQSRTARGLPRGGESTAVNTDPENLQTGTEAVTQERISKATTELERSGITAGVSDETIRQAERISQAVGRQIRFFSEEGSGTGIRNGYFDPESGTIFVNAKSENPVAQIIGHELTHSVELADAYAELAGIVKNRIAETGQDLEAMRQETRALYEKNGVQLTEDADVDSEIIAEYVEQHLLTDEESILRLAQENRTLAQRIRDWLDRVLARLGNRNAQERVFLQQARDAYQRALNQSAQNSGKDLLKLREMLQNGTITEEEYDALYDQFYDAEDALKASNGTQYSYGRNFSEDQIRSNALDIQSMNPVAQLSGNEFEKSEVPLRNRVLTYLQGKKMVNPELGEIRFTNNSFRSNQGHGHTNEKIVAYAAVPEVIENGKVIDYSPDHNGKPYDRITIAAPVTIAGTPYYMGIMVQRDQMTQRFYIHDVITEEKARTPFTTSLSAESGEDTRGVQHLFITNIIQRALQSNPQFSGTRGLPGGDTEHVQQPKPLPGNAKNSISESFPNEIDDWDGKTDKTFRVGTTSNALKSIGVEDRNIIWHSAKISKILRDHAGMTREVIKQVPEILEHPIVVLQSKSIGSRLVVFGEVQDANGAPVTAILELAPTSRGGELLDMNVIASAYGKDASPENFIQSSGLVYLDPNKNRTKSWLQGLGLQLPSDTTAFGSVGSVSYQNGKVKIESVPFAQYMQTTEENTGPQPLPGNAKQSISEAKPLPGGTEAGDAEVRELPSDKSNQDYEPMKIERLPAKAQNYLKRAESTVVNRIGDVLSVPKWARREYLNDIVHQASTEYLERGQVSDEMRGALFNQAYDEGVVVDEEFYNDYRGVKDELRKTKITISEQDASSIPDFKIFRKQAFGTLRIVNEGGTPVDAAYQELSAAYPGLFPENITHPADQLIQMYEAGRSIQRVERSLDEYYGADAAEFRKWAQHDFNEALDEHLSELNRVKRYAEEKTRTVEDEPITAETVKDAYAHLKESRRAYEKAAAKNLLTQADEAQVARILRGEITTDALDAKQYNVKGIRAVAEAKAEYEKIAGQIRAYKRQHKATLLQEADSYLGTVNTWKDKKLGVAYSRETMERNIRDIVKDQKTADAIIDKYFAPVHQATADANKMKNQYRDRVRGMKLSRKVAEGNIVSEAHAVQLLGEAEDNMRMLEKNKYLKERDGRSYADWKGIVDNLWKENPNLDQKKIRSAVDEFRKIYNEAFEMMNEARIRNGYEPVNYRSGYFPHFQPGDGDGIIAAFGKAMGIDMDVSALPTTINGMTHTFRPGIQWFGHAQERLGFNTVYDAVEGFDKYIEGVADVIYHTDNIQRLRALEEQIRYRSSDKGIRERADKIRMDESRTEEDRQNALNALFQDGKYELNNFVVNLAEYTNILANKKSQADRNMEYAFGRKAYNVAKALESRVAANMVAINPGSWLTNFIPLTQGGSQLGTRTLLNGMWDTLKSYKSDDGFAGRSVFLTNRRGSDPIVKTWEQSSNAPEAWKKVRAATGKASDVLSSPMEYIDQFTSDSLVRARYAQNIARGLSEEAAMNEADSWTAGVMADRSKGSMPTLFSHQNPAEKIFTQFQLEVNNQLSWIFKDVPRDLQGKGVKALAAMLLKFCVGSFIYNELYEWLVGRRAALDPIDMLRTATEDIVDGKNAYEVAADVGEDVAENLPFVGGLLGGGRVPISSALPDVKKVAKTLASDEIDGKKKWETTAKELGNSALYMGLPFGGGQVKKIVGSAKALARGGSYTVDNEGNDILQYPVETNGAKGLLTGAQALLFGKSALPGAREWTENGFKSLSAKQTKAYQELVDAGENRTEVFQTIQNVRGIEDDDSAVRAKAKRDAIRDAELSDDSKRTLYNALIGNGRDDEFKAMQRTSMTWDQIMDMYDAWDELNREEDKKASQKAMEFAVAVDNSNLTARQKQAVKENLKFYSMMAADTERYDALTAAGLSPESAKKTAAAIAGLEPENGKESVTYLQKYQAIVQSGLSDSDAMAAMKAVMPESSLPRLEVSGKYGVTAAQYVEAYAAAESIRARKGEKSVSQETAAQAIANMSGLTQRQKAVLWQVQNKSWKGSRNPFDTAVGNWVYNYLHQEVEQSGARQLPGGTSSRVGALGLPK